MTSHSTGIHYGFIVIGNSCKFGSLVFINCINIIAPEAATEVTISVRSVYSWNIIFRKFIGKNEIIFIIIEAVEIRYLAIVVRLFQPDICISI